MAKSSYLRFLPPTLWEGDPSLPQFSLGAMLRIFEKILTGIDDGVPLLSGNRQYAPLQDVIARTFRLYQSWAAPPQFLDWLAQWVALQFSPVWDEYQRRKILSEIIPIYSHRGTKDGLDQFFALYAVSARRPRVVIDDANKILFTQPSARRFASIYTLVSQPPLIAPHCIALGPDGSFFVGDIGNNVASIAGMLQIPPGVWRLSAAGQYDYAAGPPIHTQPLGPTPAPFVAPVAVAVDAANPWGLYVLDGAPALYRLTSPAFNNAAPLFATAPQLLNPQWLVGMTVNAAGDPLILDRGAPPGQPSVPRILEVSVAASPPTFQPPTRPHPLGQLVEPLCLALLLNGTLVVGDGRDQANAVPADLFLVDPANGWAVSSLLGAVANAQNPLIAPSAVVQEDATHLLVLDIGLKPFTPNPASPFNYVVAQHAAVYRVDLSQNPPTIVRVTETEQLVYPRGMVRAGDGMLHICDPGYPDLAGGYVARQWRALPQTFAAVVAFPGPPAATPQARQARDQFLQSIRDVVTDERPVQSFWTVQSETG